MRAAGEKMLARRGKRDFGLCELRVKRFYPIWPCTLGTVPGKEKALMSISHKGLIFLVGMARFERAVSASRTQRSTRLSHIP